MVFSFRPFGCLANSSDGDNEDDSDDDSDDDDDDDEDDEDEGTWGAGGAWRAGEHCWEATNSCWSRCVANSLTKCGSRLEMSGTGRKKKQKISQTFGRDKPSHTSLITHLTT